MKVVETLDFGYVMLDNGDIVKSDGTIITAEDYARLQSRMSENTPQWQDIETQEALEIIKNAEWLAKIMEDTSNPDIQKMSFAGFDNEGEPIYLRTQTFLGAESNQYAETEYAKVIYQIRKNRPELLDDLGRYLEEKFGTEEQVGTIFEADDETVYTTKSFIKDGYLWKLIFKNGEVSNVKKVQKLHRDMETGSANEKGNAIANALATGGFDNIK
jgi:hypothetical protein